MDSKNVVLSQDFEIIGHRGHVSHYPENSLEGVISAVSLGIDAVELDLVVSADKKIVVSHEPYMAAATVLTPQGKRISKSEEKNYNLFKMTYDSIKMYKTGLTKQRKFKDQEKIGTYKPLLEEVLKEVEEYRLDFNAPAIRYYLEVKSEPSGYGTYQPYPSEFADLLMKVVKKSSVENNIIIQSFDTNFLNILKEKYPEVQTSLLVYRTPWEEKLEHLKFKPDAIGPYYKQLGDKEQVKQMQALGFKVTPWTVNSKRRIKKMINLGVDGIITDYPEKVLDIKD